MSSLFPTVKSDPALAPFRAGLVFEFFNALTWQIGIGTPMVLFAECLGATPFQVGLAYSFVFLLTLVQVAATALLPHFRFKRASLGGFVSAGVLLVLFARMPEGSKAPGEPLVIGHVLLNPFRAAPLLVNLVDLPRLRRGPADDARRGRR